jgi:transposase-like protein
MRQGFPAAKTPSGTSRVTTLPAPMTAFEPMQTPGRMSALYGPTAWGTTQIQDMGSGPVHLKLENASMPWKESRTSDERLKFIAQRLSGDSTMTELCRRFGVSRKTGYKWKKRYEAGGPAALEDLSRRPHSHSHAIPEATRERFIEMRQKHPTWGARKVRARLLRLEPNERWPSASTIHRAIAAAGLTRVPKSVVPCLMSSH